MQTLDQHITNNGQLFNFATVFCFICYYIIHTNLVDVCTNFGFILSPMQSIISFWIMGDVYFAFFAIPILFCTIGSCFAINSKFSRNYSLFEDSIPSQWPRIEIFCLLHSNSSSAMVFMMFVFLNNNIPGIVYLVGKQSTMFGINSVLFPCHHSFFVAKAIRVTNKSSFFTGLV